MARNNQSTDGIRRSGRRLSKIGVLALALVFALIAGACGDDDDASSPTDPAPTETTAEAEPTETPEAEPTAEEA